MFKPLLLVATVCLVASCTSAPEIPVSDTLQKGLRGRYDHYVWLLNNACDEDTASLHNFLQIDYLSEGPAYDHGSVLIKLINKTGDKPFLTALKKLTGVEVKNVRAYFERGMDVTDESAVDSLFVQYPESLSYLHLAAR